MGSLFGGDAASRIAARMLHEDYDGEDVEELFSMSIRVPASLRVTIDSMAQQAGVSRNVMAIDLLRAGVQDVLRQLPPELAQEIVSDAGEDL